MFCNMGNIRRTAATFLQLSLGKRAPFSFFILLGIVISLAAASVFVAITGLLITKDDLIEFDVLVVYFIDTFRSEALTPFFEALTFLGDSVVVIGILAISVLIGLIRKHWALVFLLIVSIVGSQLFVFFMKQFIARPRPSIEYRIIEVSGYSFPSGHAVVAIALYGLLWYIIFRLLSNWFLRIVWTVIMTLLIGGIAISRVYLGVHYPSDIIAGLSFGVAWVVFLIVAYEIWDRLKKRKIVMLSGAIIK